MGSTLALAYQLYYDRLVQLVSTIKFVHHGPLEVGLGCATSVMYNSMQWFFFFLKRSLKISLTDQTVAICSATTMSLIHSGTERIQLQSSVFYKAVLARPWAARLENLRTWTTCQLEKRPNNTLMSSTRCPYLLFDASRSRTAETIT
jgi:hypothetical protein